MSREDAEVENEGHEDGNGDVAGEYGERAAEGEPLRDDQRERGLKPPHRKNAAEDSNADACGEARRGNGLLEYDRACESEPTLSERTFMEGLQVHSLSDGFRDRYAFGNEVYVESGDTKKIDDRAKVRFAAGSVIGLDGNGTNGYVVPEGEDQVFNFKIVTRSLKVNTGKRLDRVDAKSGLGVRDAVPCLDPCP